MSVSIFHTVVYVSVCLNFRWFDWFECFKFKLMLFTVNATRQLTQCTLHSSVEWATQLVATIWYDDMVNLSSSFLFIPVCQHYCIYDCQQIYAKNIINMVKLYAMTCLLIYPQFNSMCIPKKRNLRREKFFSEWIQIACVICVNENLVANFMQKRGWKTVQTDRERDSVQVKVYRYVWYIEVACPRSNSLPSNNR